MMSVRFMKYALAGAAVLLSFATSASAAGLWDKLAETGTIRCGAMKASPPQSYTVQTDAQYEGYSIDLCRQIAADFSKEIGKDLKIEFVETAFPSLILDIQAGRLDIWPGMAITPERLKAINMAKGLYGLQICAVNRKGLEGQTTWEDYNRGDLRIAAMQGTTDEQAVKDFAPKAQRLPFPDFGTVTLAVQSGRADVAVGTVMQCLDGFVKHPDTFSQMIVPTPAQSFVTGSGLARDEDQRFTKWLEAWSDDQRKSGKMRDMFLKALQKAKVDITALPDGVDF